MMKSVELVEYEYFSIFQIKACGPVHTSHNGVVQSAEGDYIITLFYPASIIQLVFSRDDFHEMMQYISRGPTGRRELGNYVIKWQKKNNHRYLKELSRQLAYVPNTT